MINISLTHIIKTNLRMMKIKSSIEKVIKEDFLAKNGTG